MARKTYSARFKFQAVLDALEAGANEAEVARRHGIHPVTLSKWKGQLLEHGHQVFAQPKGKDERDVLIERLERMLGQKEVELALMRNFGNRS